MPNPVLDRLEAARNEQVEFIDQTLARAASEDRDLVDAELRNVEASRARISEIDAQIEPIRDFEQVRNAHRDSNPYRATAPSSHSGSVTLGAQTNSREYEYRSAGEYLADAYRAARKDDQDALGRIQSHGFTIANGKLEPMNDQARASAPHVTTVEVPGVLPVSIVGNLISDIDAARPFLSSLGVKDMSGIPGKTFTRPIVTEHVQMGTQTTEKTAVQAGQLKIDDVDFTKSTEAGYVNVSRQSIDWSSPAIWDALLADFQAIYARHTENKGADAFVTAVQAGTAAVDTETAGADPTVQEYIKGLYAGAVQVYSATGSLPDMIWQSLDEWAAWGALIDGIKATTNGNGGGNSNVGAFTASMLSLPRIVVPSFASGVTIIGRRNRAEAYEERLGFLTAVEPSLLGVEVAYGGYFAFGVLDADAFAELTFTPAAP